ncbi:MAG: hypothetical protein RIQ81_2555 [Pseudomonadota bacterium]|jgi:hypothetical protein
MTAILLVAGGFALVAVCATLAPFYFGRGGRLAAAATIDDPDRLAAMKAAIVSRYVQEEASYKRGEISTRQWERRSSYLRHRWLDVARRLDFIASNRMAPVILAMLMAGSTWFGGLTDSAQAAVAVEIGPRHAIMLRGGVDQLWGHYVFTVNNPGDKASEFASPVMLPAGAIDVRPQEGISQDEVVVGEGGALSIKKIVEPGVHLLSFGFILPSKAGQAEVDFAVPYPVAELQVLVQKNAALTVSGNGLVSRQERVWNLSSPLEAGSRFAFSVAGIVEGRQRLWILGSTVAAILCGLAAAFAIRTSRREGGASDEEVLGV